jgi:uncharacterized protein (TIGR02265 family)
MWSEPPWQSPLDPDAAIRAIPEDATITGMFLEGAAKAARDKGLEVRAARARYTPFQHYPLKEHCQILIEVSQLLFPRRPLRESLRRLGRGAPYVLMRSTVGRVVLGSAEGPIPKIEAMARSYTLHMRPCTLAVETVSTKSVIIHLSDIYNFLDSHNVGVFEGVLQHAGVESSIRMRGFTRTSADFLCEW